MCARVDLNAIGIAYTFSCHFMYTLRGQRVAEGVLFEVVHPRERPQEDAHHRGLGGLKDLPASKGERVEQEGHRDARRVRCVHVDLDLLQL